jgi:hypothetical protein
MRREKQKTVHHFSFVHLPPAAVSTAILFLLIAGGLFMSRLFIPDVFGPKFRQGAVSSVELYKLSDDLHQGLFRASPRSDMLKILEFIIIIFVRYYPALYYCHFDSACTYAPNDLR